MSGTSMDGIDVALLRTDGKDVVEQGAFGFYPYAPKDQTLLKQALGDAVSIEAREERPGCLKAVERRVTELHASAVKTFLSENTLARQDIDLIGFHGQTVLHRPERGLTVQLGDGEALAKATGIDVVYDMRANDMKHGGQGAPLVPVYHQALASSLPKALSDLSPVVFVNIGGISNISYIASELIAFDTGPGNALIDQWVETQAGIPFDQGGMIASEGVIHDRLLKQYLDQEFFTKPYPKSLDRNDFLPPDGGSIGVADGARTLARVSAEAIFKSVEHLPDMPALWIICGGGRHNPHIMADLKEIALSIGTSKGARVIKAEEAELNGDALEAECWAYLAVRSLYSLPLTFPGTTGCKKPVSGGVLARAGEQRE